VKNFLFTLSALTPLFMLAACATVPLTSGSGTEHQVKINTGAGLLGTYLQGAVAETEGNFDLAQRAYLHSLTDDPDNLALRQRVFQLSLLEGDTPTALRLAKTLPPSYQNQTMPQLLLGVDALHQNNLPEASTHFNRAGALAPQLLHFVVIRDYLGLAQGQSATTVINDLQSLKVPPGMAARRDYHVGRMYLKAGDQDHARAALEQAEQLEPGTVFTTRLLGELYEHAGDKGHAAEVYSAFRKRNPTVPLFGAAIERLKSGQMPPAFASTVQQDVAEVLFDFGLLVWVQGADGPARQIMNLTMNLTDGSDPYAVYYAALIGELGEQNGLSRARYEALLKNPDLRVAANLRLAQMDFNAGKKREAYGRLSDLLGRSGVDDPVVERMLADTLFADKQYAEAARHYKNLLPLASSQSTGQQVALWFAYGACLERMKQYDAAGDALKKAVALDSTNAQILNYLGYMWVEQGQHLDEAFELLKRANLLAPTDGAITDSLGWAYHIRGNDTVALSYLERAAEQEPTDATVNEHLGDLYMKLGRKEEALRQWRLALQLAGDDAEMKARVQAKLDGVK
jgi:tetratricopeptide (TPR) repeat protein